MRYNKYDMFTSRQLHQQHKRGFTLIELLVVIAIIGTLASVVLASLNSARERARDVRRAADVQAIRTALELYALDHQGSYPIVSQYGETDSGGWDYSKHDGDGDVIYFLDPLVEGGYLTGDIVDPINDGQGDVCCPSVGGSGYSYAYFNYELWTGNSRQPYVWIGYRQESNGAFRWYRFER